MKIKVSIDSEKILDSLKRFRGLVAKIFEFDKEHECQTIEEPIQYQADQAEVSESLRIRLEDLQAAHRRTISRGPK